MNENFDLSTQTLTDQSDKDNDGSYVSGTFK